MRFADGGWGCFAEAEGLDFSGLDEFFHSADCFFDGYFGIDSVLVVEVDLLDAEALEGCVAGLAHVLGATANATVFRVAAADDAELGGNLDLVAPSSDRFSDELLIGSRSVHVGGVEELDTAIEGGVYKLDRFLWGAVSVELAHAHAAKAHAGDFDRAVS